MYEKLNLTVWHLMSITLRVDIIRESIQDANSIADIVKIMNRRGYVVLMLTKNITDECDFKFHDGAVFYRVSNDHMAPNYSYYVEVLSKDVIDIP